MLATIAADLMLLRRRLRPVLAIDAIFARHFSRAFFSC